MQNLLNVFCKCTWLLKPERPLWNEFMQMIYKGDRPEQSSVIFMPMIDMKFSNESCILSTMYFVSNQAKQYNVNKILTFNQPLYWKDLEIQNNLPDSSQLKQIVLRLGGLHTCELAGFYWLPNDINWIANNDGDGILNIPFHTG